jgi:hypothetical protein
MQPTRRRVHIINTGGTFGMKANADGSLAPVEGYATERVRGTNRAVPHRQVHDFMSCADLGIDLQTTRCRAQISAMEEFKEASMPLLSIEE